MIRVSTLAFALAWGVSSFARPLNEGWTADGIPVTLPHCWNIADGTDGPTDPKANNHDSVAGTGYARKKVVYRRALPPPTDAALKRYLRVHAASIHAVVKVDGREIGRHAGAFTAFTFALPPDGKNLEIEVDNFFDPDVPPIGGDFTMYGGLYRGVELIEAPPSRAFAAADGLFADELAAPTDLPRYVFREDGFYVDGKKTFLRGVNYHQDREGKGWAISSEDEEADIRLIKAMGANAIRTSHYPRSERFYDLCDKYGLYVWTEIPLVDATTDSAAFRSNTLHVAREMVLQHRRHKCIAMWGLFNELYLKKMPDGQAEPLVREVKELIRLLDPRPTVAANFRQKRLELNAIPDALGFNLYPGWYNGESSELGERIEACRTLNGRTTVAVSEYGGGGSLGQLMPTPDFRPEPGGKFHPVDYQLKHHVASWAAIKANPRVWGAFVWVMFDCGSDNRREGARDGLNDKGLVAFDHKTLKPAYEFYKREWGRLSKEAARRAVVVATNDFQKAIDAVAAAGGGTVRVPSGEYVTGGVQLRSHVTLELSEGARLVSNGDLATYAHRRALVYAENAEDIALVGKGTVCGSGGKFPMRDNAPNRPFNVMFMKCRDFRIEDVRLTDAAAWTCSLRACERGVVRGVRIFSHANSNNDGLDIEASDLLVEDCDIDADDDALCFKNNSPTFVCQNIRVRNCRVASNCNAIKFGTTSYGTWRDVTVENCAVRPCSASRLRFWHTKKIPGGVPDVPQGLGGIVLEVVDGGVLEDVTVRGITMEGVQTPIVVRLAARHEPSAGRATRLENVLIENVTGTCLSRIASSITGVPGGKRPRGLTLRNVDLTMPGGATEAMAFRRRVAEAERSYPENRMFGHILPAWGIYLRHADDVRLENVNLRLAAPDARPDAVIASDVTGLVATGCNFTPKVRTEEPSAKPVAVPPVAPPTKPAWSNLEIRVTSTRDGSPQPGYLYVPPVAQERKVPLFVVLHSWSLGYDFTRSPGEFGLSESVKRGWAFYYPHFRGPNVRPEACGSDLAVQDIVDGVAYAKAHANIDPDRIYLLGGSGGGHMALLMAGRHPEIWAGVVAACPISDVGRWHAETSAMTNGNARYARMLEAVCGGTPRERPDEYRHRSPVTWLVAATGVPILIQTGIHDGHRGNSVPVGHAIRAFNCLAADAARVSDETIAFMEKTETVPTAERFEGTDPFYPAPARAIYLRRQAGNAQLTVFNAGHAGNYAAGVWWLARQRRGQPADWTLPKAANAAVSAGVLDVTR